MIFQAAHRAADGSERRSCRRRCGRLRWHARLTRPVDAGARPSPRPPRQPSSRARERSRIEEASTHHLHRLGTGCGRWGETPSPGLVRQWKAPRVQRSALSFAGERVRRPYPARARGSELRDAPARERRDSEVGSYREAKPTPDDADVSGRRIVTNLRQEVSEPIGLGRSVHRERSRWTESSREATPALCRRPLTRETSTGRSAKVESAIRSPALAERRAGRGRKLPFGGTRRKPRALGSWRKSRARRVWGASSELAGVWGANPKH
jgi:hypothetical protein